MEQNTIAGYVTERVRSGLSKAAIVEQLQAVGWSEEEALVAYRDALVATGVPVPSASLKRATTKRASTVEIVLNFFSFILLGIVASALGVLYFQVINHFFPDALQVSQYGGYAAQAASDAIHYSIAALIIAFPLYVAVVRLWFKRYREDEGKEESKLTKWLTYIVLLIASVTIVGDLITTLNTFLSGEISVRFFLKALTIVVIAGMVFGFYFLERKKIQYGQDIPRSTFQWYGWGIGISIIFGIALGFGAVGSPETERMRSFDAERADHLSQLAQCVSNYSETFGKLPESTAELAKMSAYSYCATLTDPESGAPYLYRIVSPLTFTTSPDVYEGTFELCADFSLSSEEGAGTVAPGVTYPYNEGTKWMEHTAGTDCDQEVVVTRKTTTGTVENIGKPTLLN
jgi:membrane protein YqaA with SNARE-associated domain